MLGLVLLYALGVLVADTHGITTDGVTYFAQLRSLVFDGDLDVTPGVRASGPTGAAEPRRADWAHAWCWTPLYLLVAIVDALGRALGDRGACPPIPQREGLGLPYVRAALLSSFAVGAAGLWALLLHLRLRFAKGVACTAVVLSSAPPRSSGTWSTSRR